MRTLFLILTVIVTTASLTLAASLPTLTLDEQMAITDLGDCSIRINFKLTAAQYIGWNQKYGQNKSLLKRDMGKLLSQYETSDWKIDVDEMDRQVTLSLRAYGVVKHNGNGEYEFDVPKGWNTGGRSGNTLNYNVTQADSESVVQLQIKLILPESAQNIKDDTGESGQAVVRYTVPQQQHAGTSVSLVLGIILAALGLGVVAVGFVSANNKQGTPPSIA